MYVYIGLVARSHGSTSIGSVSTKEKEQKRKIEKIKLSRYAFLKACIMFELKFNKTADLQEQRD